MTKRIAVTPPNTAVLIQKNAGKTAYTPVQRASNSHIGKWT
jgi:hypothetical protein